MFQNTKIFLILFIISMFLGSNSHAQSTKLRDAFKNSKTSYQSGNLEKAIKYTNEAIALSEIDFGINHFYTATLIANLGTLQYEKSLFKDSEVSFLKSLNIRKKVLDINHEDIAETLNYIALNNRKLNKFEEALNYHNEALLIMSRSIAKTNPHAMNERNRKGALYRASAMHTKALIEIKNGNINDAIGLLKTASRIFANSLGKDKTELIEAYEELYKQAKTINDSDLVNKTKNRLNKLLKDI
tara:strand:- start:1418 stop:2146 length:729 start_codon:yes stop_codon:yes gene_type:complete